MWLGGGSTGQEQNLDCVALWRPSGESASRRTDELCPKMLLGYVRYNMRTELIFALSSCSGIKREGEGRMYRCTAVGW